MTLDQVRALANDAVMYLASKGVAPLEIDRVLQEAIKLSREKRYFGRGPAMDCQHWLPVLRRGYDQYEVSNWGFVRHRNKPKLRENCLKPAYEHSYARAPMKAPHRKSGGHQHMIHELVYESFLLKATLESLGIENRVEVINHKDGDKWNPCLENLELTTQGENMLHAYRSSLRKPRT